jgi:hypothetical protein
VLKPYTYISFKCPITSTPQSLVRKWSVQPQDFYAFELNDKPHILNEWKKSQRASKTIHVGKFMTGCFRE